jgi:hypothetical protein
MDDIRGACGSSEGGIRRACERKDMEYRGTRPVTSNDVPLYTNIVDDITEVCCSDSGLAHSIIPFSAVSIPC